MHLQVVYIYRGPQRKGTPKLTTKKKKVNFNQIVGFYLKVALTVTEEHNKGLSLLVFENYI